MNTPLSNVPSLSAGSGHLTAQLATDGLPGADLLTMRDNDQPTEERYCWICLNTEEEPNIDRWIRPCRCSGDCRWVHQYCLFRWIDGQQAGDVTREVSCPQCRTAYIITLPAASHRVRVLERVLASSRIVGFCIGIVRYGAKILAQAMNSERTVPLIPPDSDMLNVLLPSITLWAFRVQLVRWDQVFYELLRLRPFWKNSLFMEDLTASYGRESERGSPPLTVMLQALCAALPLAVIALQLGCIFRRYIEDPLYRAVAGGLLFLLSEGAVHLYIRCEQILQRKDRRVADFSEGHQH